MVLVNLNIFVVKNKVKILLLLLAKLKYFCCWQNENLFVVVGSIGII